MEIVLKPSESDSEEEDLEVPQEAPKKQKPTDIVFWLVDSPPPSSISRVSTPLVNPPPFTSSNVSKFFVNPPPP